MEQFRQIGEALGGLKALMVFRENIQFNERQCCLLLDIFTFVYGVISEEITQNLIFVEKHTKWKIVEQPLKEIHKIFKEGESYIKRCLESTEKKYWWAKAITLYNNNDCVEFYIHNLLSCIPIVIEAIECAGEISGWDQEEMQRKRLINSNKYRKEYRDMSLFQWKFGKQYLLTQDFCNRYNSVLKEDRWFLLNKIREKKMLVSSSTKYENQLTDILLRSLEKSESLCGELLPSSILVGSKDYQVKRRLGNGSLYKEIIWLGESFVTKQFFGDIEALEPEIVSLVSLSHPNIMKCFCAFSDEDKKECILLMELMSRNLCTHIKEIYGPKTRVVPLALPMAVDLMLQIARGMEYLHSKKIYHGELNPSNILVKPRSSDGYLYAKVSGFGVFGAKSLNQKGSTSSNENGTLPFIWYAPEVLEEQQQAAGEAKNSKYTEKSDVYSFGMVCFELLTGKVPFEDNHLQGDKMSRNIRAGERPLFTYGSPKYVTNLTKKCWHADPVQRPSFSSICRILRYTKRFLALNPDYNNQLDPPLPPVDYCDIEATFLRNPSWGGSSNASSSSICHIPFQMFAYRVIEKEKVSINSNYNSESGSDASACGDDLATSGEELYPSITDKKSLLGPDNSITINKRHSVSRRSDSKANTHPGTPKGRSVRPPQMTLHGRSLKINSETSKKMSSPRMMRRTYSECSINVPRGATL